MKQALRKVAENNNREVCLQELLHESVVAADSALRRFQSCVRTTLLLSNGYERQEKVSHHPVTLLMAMNVKRR